MQISDMRVREKRFRLRVRDKKGVDSVARKPRLLDTLKLNYEELCFA